LEYGKINPRNADLDSFNHHVTAGWVAVSDRRRGMLIAESADVLSSFAFVPMRLREIEGRQQLWLNPFGSYHGRQMDYSHLGGNGVGTEIAVRKGAQFLPNAASYNGMTEQFSVLIAPYEGDAPPLDLQADAELFFYPPVVVYARTPATVPARLPEDVRRLIGEHRLAAKKADTGPLPVPASFLVNPTLGAVDVVWDEPPDPRVDGYEIQWRVAGSSNWENTAIKAARRYRIDRLQDGAAYDFRMRATGAGRASEWTAIAKSTVGPVGPPEMADEILDLGPRLWLKILYYSLVHVFGTRG
jgi:hypothetical protein